MNNNKIFNYSWADIQAMQQGDYTPNTVPGLPAPPSADKIVIAMECFNKYGSISALEQAGMYGAIDILKRANKLPDSNND